MANRELKTKIKLRYDLLANWTAKNPELLAGEIAIVAIPSGVTEMQVDGSQPNPPQILFKVGPGNFNDLSYASAKAADVYGWAKAASKPTYTAAEVGAYSKTELDPILAGLDHNTTYRFDLSKTNEIAIYSKEIGGEESLLGTFKVDFEAINAEIAKKLDSKTFNNFKSGYDTTIEGINESLNKKLESSDIAGKADTTYVDNKLAEKVNLSDYNTKIGEIEGDISELSGLVDADIKEINDKFEDYYTKTEVNTELGKKADQSYVVEELGKKVDASDLNSRSYATTSQLETGLNTKVDKTVYEAKMESLDGSISSLDSNKVNNSDFEAYKTEANGKFLTEHQDISGKADITYVDSEIKKVDDAVKLLTNGAGTDEIDSVNELIDYVNKHGATVTGLQNDIKANADAIDVLEAKPAMGILSTDIENWNGIEGRVDDKLAGKVDREGYVAYSQAEKEKLAGLENYDDSTVKGLISAEETRAKGVEEGLESRIKAYEDVKDDYALKSELFSGDYEDLTNKPDLAIYETVDNVNKVKESINTEKGRIDTLVTETIPGINGTIETLATKAEVSEAITNSHKHDNKAILDATTASFTTELKAKYDGYESSINDFVTNKHGYATKSEVESVSNRVKAIEDDGTILRETDVFVWDCGGAE